MLSAPHSLQNALAPSTSLGRLPTAGVILTFIADPRTHARPIPVTVIGLLLIASGAAGLIYHLSDFSAQHPFQFDVMWIALIRLLAIVGGIFLLFGRNWARWLALGWIALHVVLSAFHSAFQLAFHALVCAAFAYFLFRPSASLYFHRTRPPR